MQEPRSPFGSLRPRTRQLLGIGALVLALLVSGTLVGVALTSHSTSDLAGTVPVGADGIATPTPTPTRTPMSLSTTPTPTPAAPAPTTTAAPLPVVDGSPVVTYAFVQFSDSIPFGYVTQEDPNQAAGVSYVSVGGSPGTLLTTIRVTYTDGVETSRSVVSEEVTASPVDQVTVVGTAPAIPEVPVPEVPVPEEPQPEPEPTTPPSCEPGDPDCVGTGLGISVDLS